jgi:hypothetical protein
MSTATAKATPPPAVVQSASTLPSKKRKASHDAAAASDRPRAESEAVSSQNSEDTTTMAFRAILDGASVTSSIPPKKRKTYFEPGVAAAAPGDNGARKTSFELPHIAAAPSDLDTRKTSFELFNDAGFRKSSFDTAHTSSGASDGPLRKRKLSIGDRPRFASIGSIDDAALGLIPLGSANGSQTSDDFTSAKIPLSATVPSCSLAALDHLDALGDEAASINGGGVSKVKLNTASRDDDDASSSSNTMASGNQRLLLEALMMGNTSQRRRDRFESWGGMSDISLTMQSSLMIDPNPLMDGAAAAAALAASAMHPSLQAAEDASNASSLSESDKQIPLKIVTRDRKYSIASLGEASVTGSSEINNELQAFVAAAMASVGDQLAELAGVVETVAGSSASISSELMREIVKDDSSSVFSNASSLPEIQQQLQMQLQSGRPRSMSTSSNGIAVDYDAVAAAVDAAEAATGALDLSHFSGGTDESTSDLLPPIPPIPPLPASSKSERDMDAIRARARAAAGYIPPANLKPGEVPPPQPIKKRPKVATPHKHSTPNYKHKHHVFVPDSAYSMYHAANKASSQKWDEMYDCLVDFVEERRKVETKGMSDKEKKDWDWDGNVPTTYKTDDGKALGRWINNQRSAKHKGSLKKDREVKLMSTGLKWSVLSTNSWQDMMEELKLYVSEKTKEGQDWDGNVPTNYKITGSTDEDGEEKNLGRWINRQRSLYQSGKLRKDREAVSCICLSNF